MRNGRAAADDQLRDARPGVRPGLRPERGPREAGRPRAEQQLRLRRAEHLADRQPVRGLSPTCQRGASVRNDAASPSPGESDSASLEDQRATREYCLAAFAAVVSLCVWLGLVLLLSPRLLVAVLVASCTVLPCASTCRSARPHLPGEAAVHHPPRPAGPTAPRTCASRPPTACTLRGCYLTATARPRRGVILFGLEFGSNRWSCRAVLRAPARRRATTSSPSSRATRARATRTRLRAAAVGDRHARSPTSGRRSRT